MTHPLLSALLGGYDTQFFPTPSFAMSAHEFSSLRSLIVVIKPRFRLMSLLGCTIRYQLAFLVPYIIPVLIHLESCDLIVSVEEIKSSFYLIVIHPTPVKRKVSWFEVCVRLVHLINPVV